MDPQVIFDLVKNHAWWALAALLIGIAVRVMKDDTIFPITIPPRVRVYVALVGGIVAGSCQRLATGASWKDALLWGLSAAITAILGHEFVIESARNGKEIPVPGLMKKPEVKKDENAVAEPTVVVVEPPKDPPADPPAAS